MHDYNKVSVIAVRPSNVSQTSPLSCRLAFRVDKG